MFFDNEGKNLRAIAAGDTAALRRLYEKYRNEMYRYAFSVLRSHQTAEDIVHDAFICIMKKAHTYNGGKEKAWIMRIVHNLAIDCIRKHGKEICTEEVRHICSENDIAFYDMIASVPELIDRQIIILRIDAGYKIKEIAALLQVSPNEVSKRYRRALKKLEKELKSD